MSSSSDEPHDVTLTDAAPPAASTAPDTRQRQDPLRTVAPDEYAAEGEFARGGLGRIIKARDRLGRIVALKELLHEGERGRARFVREALLTARLQHPGIVPIHEAGRWPSGSPFYAMKLVAGRTLKDLISARPTLDERLGLIPNVIVVAEAIAYAHHERVIHRDLKPSNILVGDYGETIVIDWGLAKDLTTNEDDFDEGPYRSSYHEDLTQDGSVLGTPAYMPPEQARGRRVDERADVYSIGAILYHVLCGQAPYRGNSSAEILSAVVETDPISLIEMEAAVPPDLAAVVARAMERDPSRRYPTASELVAELRRFQLGQLVSSHHYSRGALLVRWLKRFRAAVAVALVALIVIAASTLLYFSRVIEAGRRAEASRRNAEQRSEDLVLEHARSELLRDPTNAIAWLKTLDVTRKNWVEIQRLAADALSRGVSKTVVHPHVSSIIAAVASSDARYLATAGNSDGVRVTDLREGRVLFRDLVGAQRPSIALSANGKLLAYTGRHRRLLIKALDGNHTIERRDIAVRCLWVNEAGDRILTLSSSGGAELLDAKGRSLHRFSTVPAEQTACLAGFIPGTQIAVVSDLEHVVTYDERSGTERAIMHTSYGIEQVAALPDRSFDVIDGRGVVVKCTTDECRELGPSGRPYHANVAAVLSFDGDWVAVAADAHTVRVTSLRTGKSWERTMDHVISCLAISRKGDSVAVGTQEDGGIVVWSPQDDRSSSLRGHASQVTYVGFDENGGIWSAALDGGVRRWELSQQISASELQRTKGYFNSVQITDNGTVILARGDGALVSLNAGRTTELAKNSGYVTNLERCGAPSAGGVLASWMSGAMWLGSADGSSKTWRAPMGLVWDVACSGDGRVAVSASADGTARKWELIGQPSGSILVQSPAEMTSVAVSTSGHLIAAGDRGGNLWIWTGDGKLKYASLDGASAVEDLAFSDDEQYLILGRFDGSIEKWSLIRPEHELLFQLKGRVQTLAVSGERIAAAGDSGVVALLDGWGKEPRLMKGHTDAVRSLVFSPDRSLLVSASLDKTVRVWKVTDGAVTVLRSHDDGVADVAFSPDGKQLVSVAYDGRALEWDFNHFIPRTVGPADIPRLLWQLSEVNDSEP